MEPLDTIPALLLPALVLIALAVFMPTTGGREQRRRGAWARFDAMARALGLGEGDRAALAAWARIDLPDAPYLVLCGRAEFDRFVASEVARLAPGPAGRTALERLAALRRQLGLGAQERARSSHDLRPDELLELRSDTGERRWVRVTSVDEEALCVAPVAAPEPGARGEAAPLPGGALWASFTREGQGVYRFRSRVLAHRGRALAHGSFLLLEERRTQPRVALHRAPFWAAVERLPDGAAPEDPEGVEVELIDISAGGLALLCDREVRRGCELGLDLPLQPGGPFIHGLRARVLGHGFREGGGPRAHFLHCAFEGLDPLQRAALAAAVRRLDSPQVAADRPDPRADAPARAPAEA